MKNTQFLGTTILLGAFAAPAFGSAQTLKLHAVIDLSDSGELGSPSPFKGVYDVDYQFDYHVAVKQVGLTYGRVSHWTDGGTVYSCDTIVHFPEATVTMRIANHATHQQIDTQVKTVPVEGYFSNPTTFDAICRPHSYSQASLRGGLDIGYQFVTLDGATVNLSLYQRYPGAELKLEQVNGIYSLKSMDFSKDIRDYERVVPNEATRLYQGLQWQADRTVGERHEFSENSVHVHKAGS